jgi:hypothetical protein
MLNAVRLRTAEVNVAVQRVLSFVVIGTALYIWECLLQVSMFATYICYATCHIIHQRKAHLHVCHPKQ